MGEHRGTIDCARACVIPEGKVLYEVRAERADAPASSDILVCPNDGCPRVFAVRDEGQGRLRVVVDGGWTIFRYYADDAPKVADVIHNKGGDRFMVTEAVVDERHDRCDVKAMSIT